MTYITSPLLEGICVASPLVITNDAVRTLEGPVARNGMSVVN